MRNQRFNTFHLTPYKKGPEGPFTNLTVTKP